MQDQSTDNSGSAVVVVLLSGALFMFGVYIGTHGRDSDRILIQNQEQQIKQLQSQLTESKAKLEGYVEGRR